MGQSNKMSPRNLFHQDGDSIYLSCIMKRPLIYFRLLGMFHLKQDHVAIKVYSLVMIGVAWINFLKSFTALNLNDPFDKVMVMKIISILWLGVNAVNSLIFYVICETEDRFSLMVEKIDKLLKRPEVTLKSKCCRKISFAVHLLCFISFMIIVGNMACYTLSFFGPPSFIELYGVMLTPASPDDPVGSNVAYRLLNEALGLVTTFSWASHFIMYLSNLVILKQILLNFNEKFSQFIQKSVIDSPEAVANSANTNLDGPLRVVTEDEFERFQNWSLEITSLLDTANECYKHFLALTLACYGPMIFLLLSVVVKWSENNITGILAVVYPFWSTMSISILGSTLFFASKINTLVKEPLKRIFEIKIRHYTVSLNSKVSWDAFLKSLEIFGTQVQFMGLVGGDDKPIEE